MPVVAVINAVLFYYFLLFRVDVDLCRGGGGFRFLLSFSFYRTSKLEPFWRPAIYFVFIYLYQLVAWLG